MHYIFENKPTTNFLWFYSIWSKVEMSCVASDPPSIIVTLQMSKKLLTSVQDWTQ